MAFDALVVIAQAEECPRTAVFDANWHAREVEVQAVIATGTRETGRG
jgi:hypothetical protein